MKNTIGNHVSLMLLVCSAFTSSPAFADRRGMDTSNRSNVVDLEMMVFGSATNRGSVVEHGKTTHGKACTIAIQATRFGIGFSISLDDRSEGVDFRASVSSEVSRNYEVVDSDEDLISVSQTRVIHDESGPIRTHEELYMVTAESPGQDGNIVELKLTHGTTTLDCTVDN